MACEYSFAKGENSTLYAYVDECGELKFRPYSSKFYIFTCLWTYDPQCIAQHLIALRYQFLREGANVPYFHAHDDQTRVRAAVYDALSQHTCAKAASIVVRKQMVNPVLREPNRFYPQFLGYLMKFVAKGETHRKYRQALIITDSIPDPSLKEAVPAAFDNLLPGVIPIGCEYSVLQHPSAAHSCLQAADYCSWAIGRYWTKGHEYWRSKIMHLYDKPELDVLAGGDTVYYEMGEKPPAHRK